MIIETIFTASLMYVFNSAKMPECKNYGVIDGCYAEGRNRIYINDETIKPKDFILFHEVGHYLFKLDFPAELFVDKETMADQFGLWIFHEKYPTFPDTSPSRAKFFETKCNKSCQDYLVNYKVPGIKYPIQRFSIYP